MKEEVKEFPWVAKVDQFINNLDMTDTKFLLKFFKTEIDSALHELYRAERECIESNDNITLYKKYVNKFVNNIGIEFEVSNLKTTDYRSNKIRPIFSLRISNDRNNIYIKFNGSGEDEYLTMDEWSSIYNALRINLINHKRLLNYSAYRKELEVKDDDETTSIIIDEGELPKVEDISKDLEVKEDE